MATTHGHSTGSSGIRYVLSCVIDYEPTTLSEFVEPTGASVTLPSDPFGVGVTVSEWNTEEDGNGDSYAAGSTYSYYGEGEISTDTWPSGAVVTLYATGWVLPTSSTVPMTFSAYGEQVDFTFVVYNMSASFTAGGYPYLDISGATPRDVTYVGGGNSIDIGDPDDADDPFWSNAASSPLSTYRQVSLGTLRVSMLVSPTETQTVDSIPLYAEGWYSRTSGEWDTNTIVNGGYVFNGRQNGQMEAESGENGVPSGVTYTIEVSTDGGETWESASTILWLYPDVPSWHPLDFVLDDYDSTGVVTGTHTLNRFKWDGRAKTLPGDVGEDFFPVAWNTSSDGSGTEYYSGESLTDDGVTALYARLEHAITLQSDSNIFGYYKKKRLYGAISSPVTLDSSLTVTYGQGRCVPVTEDWEDFDSYSVTVPGLDSRTGYILSGWLDDEGTLWREGDALPAYAASVTLTPLWNASIGSVLVSDATATRTETTSSTDEDETGECALVTLSYTVTGKAPADVTVSATCSDSAGNLHACSVVDGGSVTKPITDSFSGAATIRASGCDAGKSYTFTITVTASNTLAEQVVTATRSAVLPIAYLTLDVLAGGHGVSFGEAAIAQDTHNVSMEQTAYRQPDLPVMTFATKAVAEAALGTSVVTQQCLVLCLNDLSLWHYRP